MLLGLDVGATTASAVALDAGGGIVASASIDYVPDERRSGRQEQDPEQWWRASKEVLAKLAGTIRGEAVGLGLTGATDGAVFLDERGEIIRPALIGSDPRMAVHATLIRERVGERRLIQTAGSVALSRCLAAKILWLRDVEPVQYRHLRRVLSPKDYVRLRLTGETVTDVTDASATLLLELRRRSWSEETLAALEIPLEWLPHLQESPEISGGLRPSVAVEIGLPTGLPVMAGAAASAAAAISAGVVDSGLIHSRIESEGVILAPTGVDAHIDPSGSVRAACHAVPKQYHLLALTPSAGASLRWWRDIIGGQRSDRELRRLAASAPIGADDLFFLPQAGDAGDSPSGGGFVGLRAHHSRAHLTRAVMEGVVFSMRDGLDVIRGLGVNVHQVRAGGSAARGWLWERLQADIFGLPVAVMVTDPSPALGAALLAGVPTGLFPDVAAAGSRMAYSGDTVEPDRERSARYEQAYRRFKALASAIQQPATG